MSTLDPTVKLSIVKTDKRFIGSEILKYVISLHPATSSPPNYYFGSIYPKIHSRTNRILNFNMIRDWCIQTWGMSCERTLYLDLKLFDIDTINKHWCWHTDGNEFKIYLMSEKDLNWFKLKWV